MTLLGKIIPKIIRTYIRKQVNPGLTFDGWGMKTIHGLPWNSEGNESFIRANEDVKKHFEFTGVEEGKLTYIDALLWRHWIVSYCVRHAFEFTNEDLDLVECGVGDGLTTFYTLRELRRLGGNAKMHLYDAWSPMRTEKPDVDKKNEVYSNSSIQRVKKNLSEFDNVIYHQGYIPESLYLKPEPPEKISYLSIDLNSDIPTIASLEYFFPRLQRGGVVLFDDYGWSDFTPTKKAVDKFFVDKPGILFPLPTGQAIYYR